MHRFFCTLVLAGASVCAPAAHAAILQFEAPLGLTGDQEAPPVSTPASGTGTATYDTDTLLLSVHLEWSDLLAPATVAHIHILTPPNPTGPVAINFVPAGFPNVQSGTFDYSFDLDNSAFYGAGFLSLFGGDVDAARAGVLAGLLEGRAYFNIHTSLNAGGEIRGNITVVPEPATLVLLGLGAAAAFARRRLA